MMWSCMSCRRCTEVFALSAVEESGILCFMAKYLVEKSAVLPHLPLFAL